MTKVKLSRLLMQSIHFSKIIYWFILLLSALTSTVFCDNNIINIDKLVCVKKGNCRCQMNDGSGAIDLSSMAVTGGDAIFNNVTGSEDKNLYSFTPCVGFTERYSNHVCDNVAVCEYDLKKRLYLNLGTPDSVQFKIIGTNKTSVALVYIVGAGSLQITTSIKLQCSKENLLSVVGAVKPGVREMILYSKCACLDGCIDRFSVGSVLLITLTFLVTTYLLVGCLYNKTVYNSNGCDLIPNYAFWSELPSLVKDGYLFFISPCLGERVEYRYYERL